MGALEILSIIVATFFFGGIVEASIDARASGRGKKIEHRLSALIRVVAAFTLSFAIPILSTTPLPYMIVYQSAYFAALLYGYWVSFDPSYNIVRQGLENIWYVGKTSVTDKVFRNSFGADGKLYFIIKVMFLISTLIGFEVGIIFISVSLVCQLMFWFILWMKYYISNKNS